VGRDAHTPHIRAHTKPSRIIALLYETIRHIYKTLTLVSELRRFQFARFAAEMAAGRYLLTCAVPPKLCIYEPLTLIYDTSTHIYETLTLV